MRISKLLCLLLIALVATGCACRAKSVGPEGENIGRAEPGTAVKDVHFAFDSYELSAPAQQVLRENAEWLKNHPNTKVVVEGHADERGTNEYNMALGAKRAEAAAQYLRSLGISGDRLSTVSYGEELPLDPGSTPEAWAKNRRAHFDVK